MVKPYSNLGDIVLDPFCGGGVTVLGCLKLRRKIVGVDLNPLATFFVTKMEAVDTNLSLIRDIFTNIKQTTQKEIMKLYLSKCPNATKWCPFIGCCGLMFTNARALYHNGSSIRRKCPVSGVVKILSSVVKKTS